MTYNEKVSLLIFKEQIKKFNLNYLEDKSDEELLSLLNATSLPNSLNVNTLKNSIFFHFVFMEKDDRKKALIENINKIINFSYNLSKTEKVLIKYGLIKGFSTKNWKVEFFKYLKNPLSLRTINSGRKFMSSYKFKEMFFFTYNLVERGKNNDRLPKL